MTSTKATELGLDLEHFKLPDPEKKGIMCTRDDELDKYLVSKR